MSRLPTKLQSYLQVLNQWRPAGFGRILGVDAKTLLHKDSNPGCSLFQRGEGGQYIFRYEIPIQACVDSIDANVTSSTGISNSNGRDNGEAKVLPLSGLLAVFDELTTLAILSEDRNNRPGVSTALSAELSSHGLMNLPRAGSIIDISVRVLKVGKIMGFANAVVTNPKGEVIATGKHTKFLPHASYLQGLMLGRFLPMLSAVSNFSQITNDNPSSSSISSVQEMVSFDPSSQPSMRVNKEFINPGGSCHGGSQAMAMEQVAQMHISKSIKEPNRMPRLQSMSVTYISAGRGEIKFSSEESPVTDVLTSVHVTTTKGSNQKSIISEGIFHYIDVGEKSLKSRL